jgi:membrane protein implicated in regulation of membrane protease activity
MNWWGWIAVGALLLGTELAFIDAQFYLVFSGTAAILMGVATAVLPGLAPATQWATFALLCIVSMLTFRRYLYRRLRGRTPDLHTGPAGSILTLPAALAPGESCQVEHGGSYWTARNEDSATLPSGSRVRVAEVRGLTLLVRAHA